MSANPEKERQRLVELYASMTSEQLLQIADEAASLTDIARGAFDAEIKRRGALGLDSLQEKTTPVEITSQTHDESLEPHLVMVRRFGRLAEALLAKGRLDSAGIDSFLADDNMVRIFIPNFFGGVRILVSEVDVAEAADVLNQPALENFDEDDTEE